MTKEYKDYEPSNKEKETVQEVYAAFEKMRTIRNRPYRLLNDRTLVQFWDDSEKRLNSYVPSREEQGKEEWEANFFHPVTRNKFKAILASAANSIPPVDITARNNKGRLDPKRAEVVRHLVDYSFTQKNDPQEEAFFEAWELSEKGTIITYDGCERVSGKRKEITSFDLVTGDVQWEEKDVVLKDDLVDFIVPIEEFYPADIGIRDLQEQPRNIWATYVDESKFEEEFSKFKRFKCVRPGTYAFSTDNTTFFHDDWKSRVDDDNPYEIIRYYDKYHDAYRIIVNGVLLLDAPMLWYSNGEKVYPFAKSIFEPFNSKFFYGNSLPNMLMGENDVINALYNMAVNKTYRSFNLPLIIGEANRDDFDLEDREVSGDTRIYVQDVQQVREVPMQGLNASEVKMIDLISRGLDLSSVDGNQSGVAGRGVTAREVVIANENALKLKGILYMFLRHLYLQKVNLRIMNILTYYTLPKVDSILGEDEAGKSAYRSFQVQNAQLSDGSTGVLGIQMVGNKDELPAKTDLDIQEEENRLQGVNYEAMAVTSEYLDNWHFYVSVSLTDFQNHDASYKQAKLLEKLEAMQKLFPMVFMQNVEKNFRDFSTAFDDDADEYNLQPPAPVMPGIGGPGAPVPQPTAAGSVEAPGGAM